MIRMGRLRILLFAAALTLPAAAAINTDFIRLLEARPGSSRIAIVEGRSALHVLDIKGATAKTVISLPESAFASHFEDAVIHDIAWSADGHFLSIDLSDGDEYALMLVLDVACGAKAPMIAKAGKHDAANGAWASTGHLLYLTPASDEVPLAEDGLYSFDPETGKPAAIVRGHRFAGPLEAGDKQLWARIAETDGDLTRYRLVSIDLKTGALTRLAP